MEICTICSGEISNITGITKLSCNHTFHPHCIHNFYRGWSACHLCETPKGAQLDFGDNIKISNATKQLMFVPSKQNSNLKKSAYDWIMDKVSPKINVPAICSAEDLVHFKAPIQTFVERGITAKNLAECGIKLHDWFDKGYTISDLQTIKVTWNDFIFMGFSAKFLSFVPAEFIVDVLKADISRLLQMGITLEDLRNAGYTPQQLLAMKCTTHPMIPMGLNEETSKMFDFTDKDWQMLGLLD